MSIKINYSCNFCNKEIDEFRTVGFKYGVADILEKVDRYDISKVHKHLCLDCFKEISDAYQEYDTKKESF